MNILYSHLGCEGKDGWGRSFYMAKALVKLGHNVTLLTTNGKSSFFKIERKKEKGVTVLVFPDFFPRKFKSSGFGIWSVMFKSFYSLFNKFDLTIADCGHRLTGIPCRINRRVYHSIYITEWWDFFGKGGYANRKNKVFKTFYGAIENWSEIHDKQNADGVITLSSFMQQRAKENGVKNICIVQGGALVDELKMTPYKNSSIIKFAYIGIDDSEVDILRPFIEAISNPLFKGHIKFVTYGKYLSNEVKERYNLFDVIEERGWINYLNSDGIFDDIDVFVQVRPDNIISRVGWPNKLGDYLALGRAVMIAPYGDLVDFVNNNRDGFIVVKYIKENIEKAIEDVLENKYDLYNRSIKNRQLAYSISWEKRASKLVAFVDEIVHKKNYS